MTFSEFKCWFDGFCHAINKRPTAEQWEMIKEKLENVSAHTRTTFVTEMNQCQNLPVYAPYCHTPNIDDGGHAVCL
ncbi:hypothetical protein AQUSIP_13070 [Aquicella siphonis]|uniref:Uncharacterized protein n=1 Tax=Aquicella siphonis TaxID=254247 RepID=A0A5E4PI38_9COXI|nr:hypothetical protein AQUSIP_13070 [Aquicella siphonis]